MDSGRTPKLFYGFYVVAACFVVLFMLWGMVLNTFPVFLKPITQDMNWGRGALTFALLMGAIGTAISAPIAGILVDRFGAKPVMATGALIVGIGLLIGSRIHHLWQLYTIFAFIGCGLMLSTVIPCSFIISNWFVSRRGAAMSGAFVGTSIGGMIMSPVANWIILSHGWRTAFVFSGATILVVVIPVVLLLIRTRPAEMGLQPYRSTDSVKHDSSDNWGLSVKEAFSSRAFWQIAALMLISGVVTGGLGNHCPAYLNDLGHSPTRAAFAWSLVMGVMVLGKIAFGPVADRWGAKNAMVAASLLFAVSIGILMSAEHYWVAMVFASIYGFACGAPLVINPLLTSGYLGMRNFGALFGILNIMATVGGAVGPFAAGIFYDLRKTYLPVFWLFFALMLVSAVVALSLKRLRQTPAEQSAGRPA